MLPRLLASRGHSAFSIRAARVLSTGYGLVPGSDMTFIDLLGLLNVLLLSVFTISISSETCVKPRVVPSAIDRVCQEFLLDEGLRCDLDNCLAFLRNFALMVRLLLVVCHRRAEMCMGFRCLVLIEDSSRLFA